MTIFTHPLIKYNNFQNLLLFYKTKKIDMLYKEHLSVIDFLSSNQLISKELLNKTKIKYIDSFIWNLQEMVDPIKIKYYTNVAVIEVSCEILTNKNKTVSGEKALRENKESEYLNFSLIHEFGHLVLLDFFFNNEEIINEKIGGIKKYFDNNEDTTNLIFRHFDESFADAFFLHISKMKKDFNSMEFAFKVRLEKEMREKFNDEREFYNSYDLSNMYEKFYEKSPILDNINSSQLFSLCFNLAIQNVEGYINHKLKQETFREYFLNSDLNFTIKNNQFSFDKIFDKTKIKEAFINYETLPKLNKTVSFRII